MNHNRIFSFKKTLYLPGKCFPGISRYLKLFHPYQFPNTTEKHNSCNVDILEEKKSHTYKLGKVKILEPLRPNLVPHLPVSASPRQYEQVKKSTFLISDDSFGRGV